MTRPDRFAFSAQLGDELRRGLPPIVGSDGGSTWLANGGHVAIPAFPLPRTGSFYLGIDLQPDAPVEQVVLGAGARGALFELRVGDAADRNVIWLKARDTSQRVFCARARGSASVARRVILTGNVALGSLAVYEIHPWAGKPGMPLDVEVQQSDSPTEWPSKDIPLAVGGSMIDGCHIASFRGRVAEFIMGHDVLSRDRVEALAEASDNPTGLDSRNLGEVSSELCDRFRRDMARLRRWSSQPTLTVDDLDDVSLVLFRWLFDKHPVLVELAKCLGIQLWIPGMTDHEKAYLDGVLESKPTFQLTGSMGPDSAFGSQWRPLHEWRVEPAFHTNGQPISNEGFIKFIRNKLGAGHFDEKDRTRWQRDLLQMTSGLQLMGQDAMSYQMKAILDVVLLAVATCRVEALVGA